MAEAAQSAPEERLVMAVEERRDAVLSVIRSAQRELVLSLFRCNDFKVLDELAAARKRKVHIRLLLTGRAKGWKKRLKELAMFLESMGAEVRRYAGAVAKYHAKYIVADDGPALVASLNFTRKCFRYTCDFLVLTYDPQVVAGLKDLFEADWRAPHSAFPAALPDRLIVGPERARQQIGALLGQARSRIRIIDHKLRDPAMLELLEARRAAGIAVEILGRGDLGGLLAHGKLFLIDESAAVVGSLSLSPPGLDWRREVAILVRDPGSIARLNEFFEGLAYEGTPSA